MIRKVVGGKLYKLIWEEKQRFVVRERNFLDRKYDKKSGQNEIVEVNFGGKILEIKIEVWLEDV